MDLGITKYNIIEENLYDKKQPLAGERTDKAIHVSCYDLTKIFEDTNAKSFIVNHREISALPIDFLKNKEISNTTKAIEFTFGSFAAAITELLFHVGVVLISPIWMTLAVVCGAKIKNVIRELGNHISGIVREALHAIPVAGSFAAAAYDIATIALGLIVSEVVQNCKSSKGTGYDYQNSRSYENPAFAPGAYTGPVEYDRDM